MEVPATSFIGFLLTVFIVFIAVLLCCFALIALAGFLLHRRQMKAARASTEPPARSGGDDE